MTITYTLHNGDRIEFTRVPVAWLTTLGRVLTCLDGTLDLTDHLGDREPSTTSRDAFVVAELAGFEVSGL